MPAVDLLLTDPPYGIKVCKTGIVGNNFKPGHKRSPLYPLAKCTKFVPVKWDNEPPPRWVLECAVAKSKWQIIWGGGHIGQKMFRQRYDVVTPFS